MAKPDSTPGAMIYAPLSATPKQIAEACHVLAKTFDKLDHGDGQKKPANRQSLSMSTLGSAYRRIFGHD